MRKHLLYFVLGILFCIVFAYLVTSFYNRNQMYDYTVGKDDLQTHLKWEGYVLKLSSEQVNEANFILQGIDYGEYAEKTEYYGKEIFRIRQYKDLILEKNALTEIEKSDKDYVYLDKVRYEREEIYNVYGWYNSLTTSQIDDKYQTYLAVYGALSYAIEYESYVQYVIDHSQKLSEIRIFDDETKDDIKSKGTEYSELSDIKMRAYITTGFEKLMDNPFGNMMAVLMVLICSIAVSGDLVKRKKSVMNEGNGRGLYSGLFIAGLICLFLLEGVAVSQTFDIGELGYPIQTVTGYKTCTVNISMGLFLLLRTVLKVLAYYVIYSGLVLIILKKRNLLSIVVLGLGFILEFSVLKGSLFDITGIVSLEKMLMFSHKEIYGFIIASVLVMAIMLIIMEFRFRSFVTTERKQAEQEYLTEINDKYNEMRTLKHDMNNHLSAVLFLMNAGRNEEAKKYLTELTDAASNVGDVKKTGMKALDLLLWNKHSLAVSKGIDFRMSIEDDYSGISVSEYEMCSLFANIIDNAIEAVEGLKANGRWISIRTARQMDMLCIFCENLYDKVEKENGSFITTKKDKENHGLGLKQIRRISEKHGGTVNIEDTDGVFKVSVIMNA
ncbi:MAG: GHKL domain-containing protein [Lachnospiraceae bacterium]|nr:GHKL domain-containing protein [Lachnospiraceae bacterium]